ncbi:STAS domain-containing protein, partial [Butyrivibrio fibrisolvens]
MEIIKMLSGNEMMIALEGRLDTTTSPLLREQIAQISPEVEKVKFDFKDLNYISSAGLREILVCRKKFSGDKMKVVNVS